MLIDRLTDDERSELSSALANAGNAPALTDALVTRLLAEMAWRRLLDRWDQVIWRFWVFKTWRYRDLEPVWTLLFGPRPAAA